MYLGSIDTPVVRGCAAPTLGGAAVERPKIKNDDVPVTSTTKATKGIVRRVREAVVKMSRSSDVTLQNTAQRIVDGDVPIRFIGDLQLVADPKAVLANARVPPAQIETLLKTNNLVEIPGSEPALVPKNGSYRAFERKGVIYIPTEIDDASLYLDIIHEVNHALNPVTIAPGTDPGAYLWEEFKAEVRASYVANFRNIRGQSNRGNVSLRFEMAIEHARQHAVTKGWTTQPGWNPAFLDRIWSWVPDGNLDNHK
jgi:hypothetical protein